jgi:hypothetical protein
MTFEEIVNAPGGHNMLAPYIEERIRKQPPTDSFIVLGSTPVVAFGDVSAACVATLGLNPSSNEFLASGRLLRGDQRRLATYESLGIDNLTNAGTAIVERVLEECNQYFDRHPYTSWFNQLLPLLELCDASYYDATACHLDLVQWATDPVWSKIKTEGNHQNGKAIKTQLMRDDAPFLKQQLRNENISFLLVNGGATWIEFKKAMGVKDLIVDEPKKGERIVVSDAKIATTFYTGRLLGRVIVIAWTANLQSSWSSQVTPCLLKELRQRVKRVYDGRKKL